MLNTEYEQVYRSLVFETNSYIGHFILKDSHVRTHYDLTDYVKRDNVWELLHKFTNEPPNAQRVLILGVGMETQAIAREGHQLSAHLGDDLTITFIATDGLPPNHFDVALIVTDMVSTGKITSGFQGRSPWL